ncbi:MAG: AfsR/SARP family transcriptional regulator [Mycobacteriales bacterium]
MLAAVEFQVLGEPQVRAGGRVLGAPGTKQNTLLALLALRANQVVPMAQIVEALWRDRPPADPRNQVQVYVSALRRLLADGGVPGELIETHEAGYLLRATGGVAVDATRFSDALAEAEALLAAGRWEEAAEAVGAALALWRGPALDGLAGGDVGRYVEAEAVRLERRRADAVRLGVDIDLALGRYESCVGELTGLVADLPYDEGLRHRLMVALCGVGRRAEALEVYREGRAVLAAELGIEPGAGLRELQEAILRGQRVPEPPFPAGLAVRGPAGHEPAGRRAAHPLPPPAAGFVGRATELATAVAALAGGPGTPVVVVTGPAGVGKSAFAVQAAHAVAGDFPDGRFHAELAGRPGVHDLLGHLLRELDVSTAEIGPTTAQRVRLWRSRLAGRRALLVLDDPAGVEDVRALTPTGGGCAVLVTSRRTLPELAGAHRVELGVLPRRASLLLLAATAGPPRVAAEPAAAESIVDLCGDLPLAIRIAGARLAARPGWELAELARLLADERGRLDQLTAGDVEVRTTVAPSYQALDQTARRAFRLLGLLPVRDFPGWVLAPLLDAPPDTAAPVLAALVDARLVEAAGDRYRMHDLLRLYARERAEAEDAEPDRVAAVRRVAAAYLQVACAADELLGGGNAGPLRPGRGYQLPDREVEALTAEPLAWFEAELGALGGLVEHAVRRGDADLGAGLAVSQTAFFEMRNYFDDWRDTHEQTLALARSRGARVATGLLLLELAELYAIQDRYALAIAHFTEALAEADLADVPRGTSRQANALAGLGYLHRLLGRYDRAGECWEAARRRWEELEDPRGLAYSRCGAGVVHLEQGRLAEAGECFTAGLALADQAGDRPGRARALRAQGLLAQASGDLAAAAGLLAEACAVSADHGDRMVAAHAVQLLADVRIGQGRLAEGERLARQALIVFQEFDNRFGQAATLHTLAAGQLAAGRPRDAADLLDRAARWWRRLEIPYRGALTLDLLAEAADRAGDPVAAAAAAAEARTLRDRLKPG